MSEWEERGPRAWETALEILEGHGESTQDEPPMKG